MDGSLYYRIAQVRKYEPRDPQFLAVFEDTVTAVRINACNEDRVISVQLGLNFREGTVELIFFCYIVKSLERLAFDLAEAPLRQFVPVNEYRLPFGVKFEVIV